ncbi:dihydrodipicolinate synthase family protein [Providencia vermicola]|uniref:dihydrodipicolinate synthase family protein n=1 Tax=Providencia vermicola TaxID=333965 RepID=UPI003D2E15EB
MTTKIEGVLTAIVTTFDENSEFCAKRMKKQVQRQISHGNGIFCNGTNGEFFVLSQKEKIIVTETCVNEVNGQAPIVAHIGEISTEETIKLGKEVAKLGVDAVSVITPFFIPLNQNELIYHYTKIADELDVPVFMYNIPARTGNTILPETAAKLALHPNIIGIKDSAGSYESLSGFLNAVKGIANFNVLNGPDSLIHQGFVDGCSACISGLANVAPKEINAIWDNFHKGDIEASRIAQESVTGLRTDLYKVAFSPAAVKKAITLMGEEVGESRYPIVFSDQDIKTIKAVIDKYIS